MRDRGKMRYYNIRISLFRLMIGCFILLLIAVFYKDELYEKWLRSGGIEEIVFEGVQSKLEDSKNCYMCGSSDKSLVDYYRQFNTIGLISLNDWYVLEFQLKYKDENGKEINSESGTLSSFGNTGEIIYSSESTFQGAMASINVTLPENYELRMKIMQEHLCQICLNKILKSLEFRKWKYEQKDAVPLCLIDFKTLEIYSLQDWHQGCRIRDYWVEIESDKNEIFVNAYTIPSA